MKMLFIVGASLYYASVIAISMKCVMWQHRVMLSVQLLEEALIPQAQLSDPA